MSDGHAERTGADALSRLAAALEDLGVAEARELVDEARGQARAHVRECLAQALSDSMLRAIAGEAGEQPGASDAVAPGHRTHAVYVYGVIDGAAELGELPTGVDGHGAVRAVRSAGLTALISDVSVVDFDPDALREHMAQPDWVHETARRHELVIEAVASSATVIPIRMGTVYGSETEIAGLLARDARALRAALRYLRGKTEWGVKVLVARPARVGPERRRPACEVDESESELRARRAARVDAVRRAEDAAEHAHSVLHGLATDSLTLPPRDFEQRERVGELLLNAVYLVNDATQEDFRAHALALARSLRDSAAELEVTGPWPAYNFVPGAIGAAW